MSMTTAQTLRQRKPPRRKRKSLAERITNNIVVVDSACWIWVGARTRGGYGRIMVTPLRTLALAHRVSYETFVGPIPEGLTVDHLCREVACVNWRHMELVTQRENTLRGTSPVALNARKTVCPKCAQPYGAVNERGARRCVPCREAYLREYNIRRRVPRLTIEGAQS